MKKEKEKESISIVGKINFQSLKKGTEFNKVKKFEAQFKNIIVNNNDNNGSNHNSNNSYNNSDNNNNSNNNNTDSNGSYKIWYKK